MTVDLATIDDYKARLAAWQDGARGPRDQAPRLVRADSPRHATQRPRVRRAPPPPGGGLTELPRAARARRPGCSCRSSSRCTCSSCGATRRSCPRRCCGRQLVADVEANAPWQRLRRSLLLLLQLLLVAILAFLAARPFLERPAGLAGDIVLVIDTSASMRRHRRDALPARRGEGGGGRRAQGPPGRRQGQRHRRRSDGPGRRQRHGRPRQGEAGDRRRSRRRPTSATSATRCGSPRRSRPARATPRSSSPPMPRSRRRRMPAARRPGPRPPGRPRGEQRGDRRARGPHRSPAASRTARSCRSRTSASSGCERRIQLYADGVLREARTRHARAAGRRPTSRSTTSTIPDHPAPRRRGPARRNADEAATAAADPLALDDRAWAIVPPAQLRTILLVSDGRPVPRDGAVVPARHRAVRRHARGLRPRDEARAVRPDHLRGLPPGRAARTSRSSRSRRPRTSDAGRRSAGRSPTRHRVARSRRPDPPLRRPVDGPHRRGQEARAAGLGAPGHPRARAARRCSTPGRATGCPRRSSRSSRAAPTSRSRSRSRSCSRTSRASCWADPRRPPTRSRPARRSRCRSPTARPASASSGRTARVDELVAPTQDASTRHLLAHGPAGRVHGDARSPTRTRPPRRPTAASTGASASPTVAPASPGASPTFRPADPDAPVAVRGRPARRRRVADRARRRGRADRPRCAGRERRDRAPAARQRRRPSARTPATSSGSRSC